MKRHIFGFLRRGLTACGFGPLALAVLYLILGQWHGIRTLPLEEVCLGILSLSALAFIAGGLNVLYQIERLPLMVAILIHCIALYASYLATYLVNGWLDWGTTPILVFTGIFVVGYFAIWGIIYSVIKKKTAKINKILESKQRSGSV